MIYLTKIKKDYNLSINSLSLPYSRHMPDIFFKSIYSALTWQTSESKVMTNVFHLMVIKKHGNVGVTYGNIHTQSIQKQSAIKSVIIKKTHPTIRKLSCDFDVNIYIYIHLCRTLSICRKQIRAKWWIHILKLLFLQMISRVSERNIFPR